MISRLQLCWLALSLHPLPSPSSPLPPSLPPFLSFLSMTDTKTQGRISKKSVLNPAVYLSYTRGSEDPEVGDLLKVTVGAKPAGSEAPGSLHHALSPPCPRPPKRDCTSQGTTCSHSPGDASKSRLPPGTCGTSGKWGVQLPPAPHRPRQGSTHTERSPHLGHTQCWAGGGWLQTGFLRHNRPRGEAHQRQC